MSTLSGQETRLAFYIQRADETFLGRDGRWTHKQSEAWKTYDRAHAGTVARQQDAKALPVKEPQP